MKITGYLIFFISLFYVNIVCSETKEVVIRGIIDRGTGSTLIQKLDESKTEDTVYLYIKSCGGTVSEGQKIIRAMQLSKAKVIAEVVDYVESIAAIIILFADQIYIRPDAIVMYHLPRTRDGDIAYMNSNNFRYKQMAQIVVNWIKKKEGLLSDVQWERFLKGENIFLSGDTFISRVSNAKKSLPISGEKYEPWRIIKCNPDYRYIY